MDEAAIFISCLILELDCTTFDMLNTVMVCFRQTIITQDNIFSRAYNKDF